MSINISNMDLTRPAREVDIVDKNLEKTGLSFTVVPQTDDQYQKTFRKAQDRFSAGKKVSAKERRDINDQLFMARISGWNWKGDALDKQGGEVPEFNRANLKDVLYGQGEASTAIRLQITEAIGMDEEAFPEE